MLPAKSGSSAEGPTLTLPDLSFDDEGVYECEAYNSEGSDTYQGRISIQGDDRTAQERWGGGAHSGACAALICSVMALILFWMME